MTTSSRNALFVLRLLWRGQHDIPIRPLSTAALARENDVSVRSDLDDTTTRNTTPTTTASVDGDKQDGSISFLETESMEYTTASLTLPPRHLSPAPIPWPTIFPHSHSPSISSAARHKFCDPLYRLVTMKQYDDAQRIYLELRSHGAPIQHRHEYLAPALRSFDQGLWKNFLLWLELYPNRAATTNHPGLKAIWDPVLDRISRKRRTDTEFTERFLQLIARKGLLPTILPPLMPHLVFTLSPARSRSIVQDALTTYTRYNSSSDSVSRRAEIGRSIVKDQVGKTWKSYLLKLVVAGWTDEAKALYEQPPEGVEWDEFTQRICHQELYERERDSAGSSTTAITLPLQLRAALRDLPTPSHLAYLIRTLSSPDIAHDHPSILERFKKSLTALAYPRATPTSAARLWAHAEIINLQQQNLHHDALSLFERSFHWTLPPHPSHSDSPTGQDLPRAYPTIHLVTTVLPSLLALLPHPYSKSILAFHQAYLDSLAQLPPSLQPTPATHNIFLRSIAHHAGPNMALRALKRANAVCGTSPLPSVSLSTSSTDASTTRTTVLPAVGEEGYAAVLLAYAGRRRLVEMYDLLVEAEDAMPDGLRRRTYKGLVAVLVKTGKGDDAEKVYLRAVEKLGEGAEDLLEDIELD